MNYALSLADKSTPQPTNFRVGAILVKLDDNHISTHGSTLELPGNTPAKCCLLKLADKLSTSEEKLNDIITSPHAL